MNKNLTNEEFVSNYLDNELSEIQRLDFENKLLHDSDLREEYSFQKELVEGIKESRRLELKSRLSNIPVSTPLYQTVGFKAIVVASISAGVGLGAYYYLNNDDLIELSDIDLTNEYITAVEESKIPDVPEAITPVAPETIKKQDIQNIISQEKPKEEAVAKVTEEVVEPKVIQPTVIQPNVVETFENEDIEAKDVSVDNQLSNLDNITEGAEPTVEIATVKDKRNKFHYKFFEKKLYLLGSFDDMPYEILELNTASGKSYFLYYNDSFYKLNSDQVKPAPLVKIENDTLVNELRIIQSNQK